MAKYIDSVNFLDRVTLSHTGQTDESDIVTTEYAKGLPCQLIELALAVTSDAEGPSQAGGFTAYLHYIPEARIGDEAVIVYANSIQETLSVKRVGVRRTDIMIFTELRLEY